MLIGIKINYVIFRFVSLIASVLWLSAISIKFAFFQNILGNQINLFLEFYLYNNFNSEFFEIFFKSLSVLIFIPVVLFSLSIKNKMFFKFILKVLNIFKHPLIFIYKLFVGSLKVKKQKNKINIERQDPIINEHSEKINPNDLLRKRQPRKKTLGWA